MKKSLDIYLWSVMGLLGEIHHLDVGEKFVMSDDEDDEENRVENNVSFVLLKKSPNFNSGNPSLTFGFDNDKSAWSFRLVYVRCENKIYFYVDIIPDNPGLKIYQTSANVEEDALDFWNAAMIEVKKNIQSYISQMCLMM